MPDPFRRSRAVSVTGRSIQPRTPQQQVVGSFLPPEQVTLGPNTIELATLEHVYTPLTQPVRGTGGQPWDANNPAASQILAQMRLTRGLYVISGFCQCEDVTGTQRIDIDVQPRSGIFLHRINMIHGLNGVHFSYEIFQAQPWRPNLTGGAQDYPRVVVTNVDAVVGRAIGWINATRKWTDIRDPGE